MRMGRGASARGAVAWALAALLVGGLFAASMRSRIGPSSDLWDYAQEARQLSRGDGFTSLYTYPCVLGHDRAPFPVRWRMPLFAVIGAALLRLGIPLPAGFLFLGALAHALTVGLAYYLAARLRSPSAGTIAAVTAFACPLLLNTYDPGNSQIPN